MSQTASAEEALAKAKEIAARLSGQNSLPPSATVPMSTTGTKRKRWGVTPAAGEAGNGSADVASGVLPGLEAAQKRVKELAGSTSEGGSVVAAALAAAVSPTKEKAEPAQKRIWVKTTNEKPPAHFGAFLSKRLPEIIASINAKEKEGDNDPTDKENFALSAEMKGKGSGGEPPPPGMPEEPLHIVLTSPPGDSIIYQAEIQVENLLIEAEEAPLEEAAIEEMKREEEAKNNPNSALAVVNNSPRKGSYTPASVAALIGQSNLPPEMSAEDLKEEEIQVPNGLVGFIIGRGGENISSMQLKTGCNVQIQKEHELKPGDTTRTITLQATSLEAIAECKERINALVEDRISANTRRDSLGGGPGIGFKSKQEKQDGKLQEAVGQGHVLVEVNVPHVDVGLVIGKQGSFIRSIQERTGAMVQVPPEHTATLDPATKMKIRTVAITHPTAEGAALAKKIIEDLLANKISNHNNQGAPQCSAQVPVSETSMFSSIIQIVSCGLSAREVNLFCIAT